VTTEMIKNEVLNTKKYIHKPSPRMDFFRVNSFNNINSNNNGVSNKFASLSKDRKHIEKESVLVGNGNITF
jgi:hypothetical protein